MVLIQRGQVLRFSIASTSVDAEIARLDLARRRSAEQLDRVAGRALKLHSAPEIEQLLTDALTTRRILERH